jgi:dihydrofolate reductase
MYKDLTVTAVVAMAKNRVIGINNEIPWHIPADLKHFKARTMGKPVIMGRRTFESILKFLGKPMPGRQSIVISRGDYKYNDVAVVDTLEKALAIAANYCAETNGKEIIIGGGAQIYQLAMPVTDKFVISEIQNEYEGDAKFPEFNMQEWQETASQHHADNPDFIVRELDRI